MIVIPAIDVLGGRCVRLRHGAYAQSTVYDEHPVDIARGFIDAGAVRIHVVDLDAARGRVTAASRDAVRSVIAACADRRCDVEVGGGVRNVDTARALLEAGAAFIVLGSVAVRDPQTALAICDVAEGRVLLGLDVRDGIARVEGWTEDGDPAPEVLRSWRDWPASGVIYTDTARDGVLAGPDLDGLRWCGDGYSGPVYLSGGVSSLDDIVACAAGGAAGVIIGKALYEGRVDLAAALRAVGSAVL